MAARTNSSWAPRGPRSRSRPRLAFSKLANSSTSRASTMLAICHRGHRISQCTRLVFTAEQSSRKQRKNWRKLLLLRLLENCDHKGRFKPIS